MPVLCVSFTGLFETQCVSLKSQNQNLHSTVFRAKLWNLLVVCSRTLSGLDFFFFFLLKRRSWRLKVIWDFGASSGLRDGHHRAVCALSPGRLTWVASGSSRQMRKLCCSPRDPSWICRGWQEGRGLAQVPQCFIHSTFTLCAFWRSHQTLTLSEWPRLSSLGSPDECTSKYAIRENRFKKKKSLCMQLKTLP